MLEIATDRSEVRAMFDIAEWESANVYDDLAEYRVSLRPCVPPDLLMAALNQTKLLAFPFKMRLI